MGFALEPEIGFEFSPAKTLHRIVHAPAAAARGDADAVDAQGEVRELDGGRDGADGGGLFACGRQALRPAKRGLLDRAVAHVDQRAFAGPRISGIDFDAVQAACLIEEREFVAHLADAEAQGARVRGLAFGRCAKRERVERGIAIAIGPPQARVCDVERGVGLR